MCNHPEVALEYVVYFKDLLISVAFGLTSPYSIYTPKGLYLTLHMYIISYHIISYHIIYMCVAHLDLSTWIIMYNISSNIL